MKRLALAPALALFMASPAAARPLPPAPTPTPSPVATAAPSPVATAEPSPAATEPPPQPTPEATPAGIAPEPMPGWDWGPPGSPPGPKRVRVGGFFGIHSPGGPGWNHETTGPDTLSTPPQSKNYGGLNEQLFAVYDLVARAAVVGEADAHQGNFTPKHAASDPTTTRSFSVASSDIALRLQTRPYKWGLYFQAILGGYAAVEQVHSKDETLNHRESRAGPLYGAAAGTVVRVAQGLDFVFEIRSVRAPGRFGNEKSLDMGGVALNFGGSVRF